MDCQRVWKGWGRRTTATWRTQITIPSDMRWTKRGRSVTQESSNTSEMGKQETESVYSQMNRNTQKKYKKAFQTRVTHSVRGTQLQILAGHKNTHKHIRNNNNNKSRDGWVNYFFLLYSLLVFFVVVFFWKQKCHHTWEEIAWVIWPILQMNFAYAGILYACICIG